jgi:hypothetical protein
MTFLCVYDGLIPNVTVFPGGDVHHPDHVEAYRIFLGQIGLSGFYHDAICRADRYSIPFFREGSHVAHFLVRQLPHSLVVEDHLLEVLVVAPILTKFAVLVPNVLGSKEWFVVFVMMVVVVVHGGEHKSLVHLTQKQTDYYLTWCRN